MVESQNAEVRRAARATQSAAARRACPAQRAHRRPLASPPAPPAQVFKALLVFFDKVSSQAPLQYIVTCIDDMLEEDPTRVSLLIQAGDK